MQLLKSIGTRLAYGVPVFFIVTFAATGLVNLMPGSPAQVILGDAATPELVADLNAEYGYDRPLIVRYWEWLTAVFQGDFGKTIFTRVDIGPLLMDRLLVTAELGAIALVMATSVAFPLAFAASRKPGGPLDRAAGAVTSAFFSLPSFVWVVLLSLLFTVTLGWLPAAGWVPPGEDLIANLRYAFLPALAMTFFETAFFFRVLRADMIATLREDFILVARSKGLPISYIQLRHVLRPSLTSFVTVLAGTIGRFLGGSVIVETFFQVPGIGQLAISAVGVKDMAVVQAIVGLGVLIYVVLYILVDLAYAWIDPRVVVK